MTLDEAKALTLGTTIFHAFYTDFDRNPQRWRVNGKVKTWKRTENQHRVSVPLKHGLYDHSYLTEETISQFTLEENTPYAIEIAAAEYGFVRNPINGILERRYSSFMAPERIETLPI